MIDYFMMVWLVSYLMIKFIWLNNLIKWSLMWRTNTTHNNFDALKQLTYMVYVFVVSGPSFQQNIFSHLVHLIWQYVLKNTNRVNFNYLFVVYLTTLSVTHTVWCSMIGWQWMMNYGRKLSWHNLRQYPIVWVEGLGKTMTNPSQDQVRCITTWSELAQYKYSETWLLWQLTK
jgi:hypothetical protein